MSHDSVLYKKIGRTPEQPIYSADPATPDLDFMVTAVKQKHVIEALASGSPMPIFRFQPGDALPVDL